MQYRKLDVNGDYSFGRGSQDFHAGAVAVAQAIKTRLLLLQGEWWEDLDQGLPLFQNILGASGSPDSLNGIDLLIQERISETPGVKSLSNYSRTFEDRTLSLSCSIETIYGDAEIDITL